MITPEYKYIIFDLDGTLSDSKQGIINSVHAACNKLGFKIEESFGFGSNIGIPLQEYFREIIGIPADMTDKAVYYFRDYYGKKGVYENKLYPGIERFLSLLYQSAQLYIATSKLEKYALVALDYLDIRKYFTGIAGADAAGIYADKTGLIKKILTLNNIANNESVVMIGDRKMDIEAAANCNIDSAGVTYGYGSQKEIEAAGPTYIVNNVDELGILILS